jgi:deazaflavin-dependent oxidoreductase (nitroreductase family)
VLLWFWRVVNPVVIRFAGVAPWWLILETKGRKSGLPRRLPLATGPIDDGTFLLVAVHGRRAAFVRNLEKAPEVRIRHKRRWYEGTASVEPLDDQTLARFNLYARSAAGIASIDPVLVKVVTG